MTLSILLQRVKAELPHGEFQSWVEANCPFDLRSAQRYMGLASAEENDNLSHLPISTSVAYEFTAPSTPTEARDEVISRVEAGEAMPVALARTIIAEHKSAALEVPFTCTATEQEGGETEEEEEETPEAYKAQLAGMPNTNQIRTWLMDVQRTTDKHAPTEVALLVKARVSKTEQRLEKKRMVRLAAWLVEYAEAVGGVSDKP